MTLLTENNKIIFAGVEFQDTFGYNFRVDQKEDMDVFLDNLVIPDADWTITGLTEDNGGTVILDTPLTGPTSVSLVRTVSQTQGVDYLPFDAFPAETHEAALDKLTMIVQQLQELIERNPIPPPDSVPGDLLVPGSLTVLGNFSSLGMRETATKEMFTMDDAGIALGEAAAGYNILHKFADAQLLLSGGTAFNLGGMIQLFGEANATQPGDVDMRSGPNAFFRWDESAGELRLLTGNGAKTITMFLANPAMKLGDANDFVISHSASDKGLFLAGGNALSDGAALLLFGASRPTQAGDMEIRSGVNAFFAWDESAGKLTVLTGAGAKSDTFSIDGNGVVQIRNAGDRIFKLANNTPADRFTITNFAVDGRTEMDSVAGNLILKRGGTTVLTMTAALATFTGDIVASDGTTVKSNADFLRTGDRLDIFNVRTS